MVKTNLDEIVDYPSKIIAKLSSSKEIIALLSDDPDVDINNTDLINTQIFDYDYVDGTQTVVTSYICVDTDIPSIQNKTIKDIQISVYVISHRDHMKLNNRLFKAVKGNRRDNIVRQIDLLLNNSDDFGIGSLNLKDVSRFSVGNNYTGKLLRYEISDFNVKRI